MWASSIAVFQETIGVSKSQGSEIFFFLIFFKNLFQLTPTLTFDFIVTIISNSSVCNNFYDARKEEGLTCQFILECRARLLEKNPE